MLNLENLNLTIQKIRKTKPMKDCVTIEEKIENVRDAFALPSSTKLTKRKIILVDDIYQTGFTMNEVGRILFKAGASSVFGLTATKTTKDI